VAYGMIGTYSATFVLMALAAALGGVLLLLARTAAKAHRAA